MKDRKRIKSNINFIHLYYKDFCRFEQFSNLLLEFLKKGEKYSLLVRIKLNNDSYTMLGEQIDFELKGSVKNEIKHIHNKLNERMNIFIEKYDVEAINSIQLIYVTLKDLPELKIENIDKININKEFFKVSVTKDKFKFPPLTINSAYFGELIINDKSKYLDLINKRYLWINKRRIYEEDIDSMYLYKEEYIIITKIKDKVHCREIYDSESGILITRVKDTIINDNYFTRKRGNFNITVRNGIITKVEYTKNLLTIKIRYIN